MVSKPDLAISYLIAVGVGTVGALTVGIVYLSYRSGSFATATIVFAIFCGILFGIGFLISGIVLSMNDLHGVRAFRIALWGTTGLGFPTFVLLGFMIFESDRIVNFGWQQVGMLSIAGGGIVGILTGTLFELREANTRTWRLNQRNTVYLRVLRHDIRNSINVVHGQLEFVRSGKTPMEEAQEPIGEHLDRIIELSDAAQRLEELEDMSAMTAVDLGAIVTEHVDDLRESDAEAHFHTHIEPESIVRGNGLLCAVVDNLLHNAIEHHPGPPTIRVWVGPDEEDPSTVLFSIEDDGVGFSEDDLDLYAKGFETALHHSDGIGLWLSHWIIESYGGSLSIENTNDGARVVARLPVAGRNFQTLSAKYSLANLWNTVQNAVHL